MRIHRISSAILAIAALALVFSLTACDSAPVDRGPEVAATGDGHEYTFEAFMHGFVGVGGNIDGVVNPVLEVNAGDEVIIHLINGENMAHDIVLDNHDIASEMLIRSGETTTITFVAQRDDRYYCSVPGHIQTGMIGDLRVVPGDESPVAEAQ